MAYTYPASAPTISGDTVTISRFLNSPTLVARRLRTILEQRYIADTLLSGRFTVSGGAVQYETGETIYTADNPRASPRLRVPADPRSAPARLPSRRPSSGVRTPRSPTSRSPGRTCSRSRRL
jgi:hypothetical protein